MMSPEFSQMSPSEMITLYMDGELPESMQPSLFSMLSEHAELRQEMHDHFMLRRHMDTNLIAPPIELQESIMRRIGAVAIGASINNPVSTGIATSMTAWLGKAVQPLMFVLLGATLSGMYFSFTNNQAERIIDNTVQTPVLSNALSGSTQEIAGTQGSKLPIGMSINQSSSRIFGKKQDISTLNTIEGFEANPPHIIPSTTTIDVQSNAPLQVQSAVVEKNNGDKVTSLSELSQPTIAFNNTDTYSPFSLTLRGFTAHSFVDQTVMPQQNPFINNVSLGLQYDLSNKDALFVEAGQEPIVQRYTDFENNLTIQYDQTYHAPWVILGWQHKFDGNSAFKPLIRVGAGAMETGPMSRLTIGLEYTLTKNITLIGGIEGMSTLYSHKGQWFSTQKAGVTYGTRISLQ